MMRRIVVKKYLITVNIYAKLYSISNKKNWAVVAFPRKKTSCAFASKLFFSLGLEFVRSFDLLPEGNGVLKL